MAAITPSAYGLRMAQSTIFNYTASGDATDTFTNAVLISGLPAGPLRTFLTATYANAAAIEAAWLAAGGEFYYRQLASIAGPNTTLITIDFGIAANVPTLSIAGGNANISLQMQIVLPHSIIQ